MTKPLAPSSAIRAALGPLIDNAPKFAVIMCNNLQYKVSAGDVIAVQRIRTPIGSEINFKKVLMVGGPRFTAIGRPLLEHCRVIADVEEQKRMRNTVSLFAPYGRRRMRFIDSAHAATIVRVKEIVYDPQVVGELEKYTGVVQDPQDFSVTESPNKVYWSGEASTQSGNSFQKWD